MASNHPDEKLQGERRTVAIPAANARVCRHNGRGMTAAQDVWPERLGTMLSPTRNYLKSRLVSPGTVRAEVSKHEPSAPPVRPSIPQGGRRVVLS